MNSKGFDDWFEVFRAGTHTDSSGRKLTFTPADIDGIAQSYNASNHEAPIVIGHPTDNAPAWGWVKGLKSKGGVLLAHAGQVVPEFADMVKQGMFKKRSISLYPDNRLKHIGFLGSVPPVVKGLKDLQFKDDPGAGAVTIEFGEQSRWAFDSIAELLRRIREYFIEKEGVDQADKMLPNWQIEDIQAAAKAEPDEPVPMYSEKNTKKEKAMGWKDLLKRKIDELPDDQAGATPLTAGQFSEADIAKAKQDAIAEGRKQAEAEFAETRKKERADARKAETKAFCERLKKEGKLLPAWEKLGLVGFLNSLDGETVIEFSEGQKKSELDFMKQLLEELPKTVTFGEHAGRDKDAGAKGTAGEQMGALARKMMLDRKDLTFGHAFAEVQRENPDLAKEYEIEIRGGE